MIDMDKAEQARRHDLQSGLRVAELFVLESARTGAVTAGIANAQSLKNLRGQYDLLTRKVLDLFQVGDERVAWWAQVELYSGFAEAFVAARSGGSLFTPNGEPMFLPPRSRDLDNWVQGFDSGPGYRGDEFDPDETLDTMRAAIVLPNSETPADMIWAPVLTRGLV